MKRILKDYLVPHPGNDHAPHLLRSRALLVMLLLVFVGELGYIGSSVLYSLPGSGYLASILPSVLVDLTNANRSANAAGPLTMHPLLEAAARLKAEDMAKKDYFAHTSPEGLTPWHWFEEAGYAFSAAGENLAVNFTDSTDVEHAWMNSEGHRANIVNPIYTEIGIATAEGIYKGKQAIFVVQMFGRPSEEGGVSEVPAPSPVPLAVAPEPLRKSSPKPVRTPIVPPAGELTPVPVEALLGANHTTTVAAANIDMRPGVPGIQSSAPRYASFLKRLLSMPGTLVNMLFAALAALVTVVFAYWLMKRFRFAHPVMITESLVFIGIVFALIFMNDYLSLLGAQII